jgi:hypothetical protein
MKQFSNLLNKKVFCLFSLEITVVDIIFSICLIGGLLLLGITTLIFKGYMESQNLLYIFYGFLFLMTALISGILGKFLFLMEKKTTICNKFKTTLKFVCYFMLLNGISYSAYIYESQSQFLYIFGIFIDTLLAIVLIHFIVFLIKMLNSLDIETK